MANLELNALHIRHFSAWSRSAGLPGTTVDGLAAARMQGRFSVGTMQLERSEPDVFIGVWTTWSQGLCIRPHFNDAFAYNILDNNLLKPWDCWAPKRQLTA